MFAILWMVSNLHASNIWSEYKFSSETALNRFDGQDFVVVLLLVLVCFDDDIIFCIPMFLNILPCIYTKLCQFFSPLFFIDIFFKLIISIKLAITHWIFLDFLYGWFSGTPLYIYHCCDWFNLFFVSLNDSMSLLYCALQPPIFRRLSAKKQLNVSYLQYSFFVLT